MTAIPPGLTVIRHPDDYQPRNPRRWSVQHTASGLHIAESLRHDDAVAGAVRLGQIADWTQNVQSLRNSIDVADLYAQLSLLHCDIPGCELLGEIVTHNGQPREHDYQDAAAYFATEGYSAADVLLAMTSTVPWSGLDTADFNTAHDRLCRLADAA